MSWHCPYLLSALQYKLTWACFLTFVGVVIFPNFGLQLEIKL